MNSPRCFYYQRGWCNRFKIALAGRHCERCHGCSELIPLNRISHYICHCELLLGDEEGTDSFVSCVPALGFKFKPKMWLSQIIDFHKSQYKHHTVRRQILTLMSSKLEAYLYLKNFWGGNKMSNIQNMYLKFHNLCYTRCPKKIYTNCWRM